MPPPDGIFVLVSEASKSDSIVGLGKVVFSETSPIHLL